MCFVSSPKEIEDEEYNKFYAMFSKDSTEPMAKTHFTAEGEVTFRSILFVPAVSNGQGMLAGILCGKYHGVVSATNIKYHGVVFATNIKYHGVVLLIFHHQYFVCRRLHPTCSRAMHEERTRSSCMYVVCSLQTTLRTSCLAISTSSQEW